VGDQNPPIPVSSPQAAASIIRGIRGEAHPIASRVGLVEEPPGEMATGIVRYITTPSRIYLETPRAEAPCGRPTGEYTSPIPNPLERGRFIVVVNANGGQRAGFGASTAGKTPDP